MSAQGLNKVGHAPLINSISNKNENVKQNSENDTRYSIKKELLSKDKLTFTKDIN